MIGNAQFIGGLFWLALGAFVTYQGKDLGLGTLNEPGSGFALFWLGLLTMGFAAAVIVEALRHGGDRLSELWANTRWQKVLLIIVLLLLFGFFFERIGFIVCSLVLLMTLMRFVDPVPWPTALGVAFGATLGVWYVMTKLLKIQLPAGLLEPWLG